MSAPGFQAPWACGEAWFGATYPNHGTGDKALDFNAADNAEAGQAVLATAPGVVHLTDTESFEDSDDRVDHHRLRMADETDLHVGKDGVEVSLWRFNGQIYIDHGNGWFSFYAHLDPSMPSVEDGAEVETGDVLGYVDQSPNPLMAFGAHLHYEQKHDPKAPYSVYEARTQRMQFVGVPLPVLGKREFVEVVSQNCSGDAETTGLAIQFSGTADDLLVVRGIGTQALGIRRYLIDEAQVVRSRETVNVRPARAEDRVLTGDFTNDGVDDIALVIQQRDGSFQIKVWSEGRYRVGSYLDPAYRYSLALNQGRTAAGDFDGDGFADDIVMAKAVRGDRTRIIRLVFDGPENVTVSRQTVAVRSSQVDDRMLVGDFSNDGIDDVAFVVQQRDRSIQVKVWSDADAAGAVYFDPHWQYSLAATQGRLIGGDFDGDGYTDDIATAKRVDAHHLTLRRFLIDGQDSVISNQVAIRTLTYRVADRMVRGDFDNDGIDDAAFVIRHKDGTYRLRMWSQATGAVRMELERPVGPAQGLIVSGNFDRN